MQRWHAREKTRLEFDREARPAHCRATIEAALRSLSFTAGARHPASTTCWVPAYTSSLRSRLAISETPLDTRFDPGRRLQVDTSFKVPLDWRANQSQRKAAPHYNLPQGTSIIADELLGPLAPGRVQANKYLLLASESVHSTTSTTILSGQLIYNTLTPPSLGSAGRRCCT